MNNNNQRSKIAVFIEVILIQLFSLGYFIYNAFQDVTLNSGGTRQISFTNYDLIHLMVYEIIVFSLVGLFLKWRGWSLNEFGFKISIEKIRAGFVLFVIGYFLYLIFYTLFFNFVLDINKIITSAVVSSTAGLNLQIDISIVFLVLFSIINAFFEEFILVGYLVTSLKGKNRFYICLFLSVVFRLSFHVYQGPIILISILPLGVLYMVYFWYKRSIVPLIIGHTLIDILALSILLSQSN